MRKFLSLVLLIIAILCASCSHGSVRGNSESASIEIRFHEIEWGSSSESVSLMITDAGGSPSVSRNAYLAYPDSVFDYSPLAPNAGNLVADSSLDVIGYNAVSMFFFSYRIMNSGSIDKSDDSLYLVRSQIITDDCEHAYKSICDALDSLYGEGKESHRTGSSLLLNSHTASTYDRNISEKVWYGAESSFAKVKLDAPSSPDDSPTLFAAFGRLDAVDELEALENP